VELSGSGAQIRRSGVRVIDQDQQVPEAARHDPFSYLACIASSRLPHRLPANSWDDPVARVSLHCAVARETHALSLAPDVLFVSTSRTMTIY